TRGPRPAPAPPARSSGQRPGCAAPATLALRRSSRAPPHAPRRASPPRRSGSPILPFDAEGGGEPWSVVRARRFPFSHRGPPRILHVPEIAVGEPHQLHPVPRERSHRLSGHPGEIEPCDPDVGD